MTSGFGGFGETPIEAVSNNAWKSGDVIFFQEQHYYKACGASVTKNDDGEVVTRCVKRIGHPHIQHEDYDGNTRTRDITDDPAPEPVAEQI